MPRPRNRLSWIYDDSRQEFTTPSGRVITLWEVARLFYDQVTGTHDLGGAWTGWKIRGACLRAPGWSTRRGIRPENLKQFEAWLRECELRDEPEKPTPRRPYLAYSRP